MNKGGKSFKEEAQKALSRGELRKALEHFQKECALRPNDFRSRLKVAELLGRLDQKKEAVEAYRQVAENYAREGFLLQAISVNKMILRIDPSSREVHDRLAQLYTERSREMKPLRPFPHIPLFSELEEKELQALLPHVQSRTFPKESLVCQEGEEGESFYVVSRGEVAILKKMSGGEEVWVRNLREGDFFGEFGFFIDRKRHASVKAVTECEILEISREKLDEITRIHPRVHEVLQKLLKDRILDNSLALSPLFSKLSFKERGEVGKRFRTISVPGETTLFQGGDPPASLYLVKHGTVEIFTRTRHKQEVVLAILESGNFFGEIGVLLGKPRMASARTTCPTELLEMTREDLLASLAQFPALQSKFKEISLKRLHRVKELLSREGNEKTRETLV